MRNIAFFCVAILFSAFQAFPAFKPANISTKGIAEGMAVHAITQDSTGMIWLATEAGLCSFDGYDLRLFSGKRIGMVNVMEISADTLLIGGTKGLLKFLLKDKRFIDVSEFPGEMVRTKAGEWIGTDKALYRDGRRVGELSDIFSVSLRGNDTFVGTINSLYRIRDGREELILSDQLLVGELLELNDEYILGTALALLFIDKESLKIVGHTELPVVKTMLSRDSLVYIGTDEGLYTINDKMETARYNHDTSLPAVSLAGDVVWCIFADKDQNIWIGTDNGVSIIYHLPVVEWVNISEITGSTRGNHIDCLLEDSHGRLWLGGTNGVICVDDFWSDTPVSRWYRMGDSVHRIVHNRIRDIFEDAAGRVWLCSDGGLFLYDESSKKMNSVKVRVSDPSWTYGISEDHAGNLLVEMVDSVYVLNPHSFAVLSKDLRSKDSRKKHVYQDAAHRKWFASKHPGLLFTGGIDRVGFSMRERLLQDSVPVPVTVTSVAVNGKGYVEDADVNSRSIKLNYDENSLSVTFSDFNFNSEHLTQYYYLIDGLNTDWIPVTVGDNKIAISYLPYGSYRLFISPSKVKSSTPQLTVCISPPWYLSTPLIVIYFILFAILIIAIINFFVQRKIIRQEKEQKAQVIEKAKQKESILQQELVVTAKNKEATADTVASDDSLLRKITKIIEEQMDNPEFSPSTLSDILDINQKQVYRKIKFLTGMSTVEYIRHLRLDHAASLLSSGNFTIAEVMYRVGFSNASYFSRSFLAQHGVSPKDYKKNQGKSKAEEVSI